MKMNLRKINTENENQNELNIDKMTDKDVEEFNLDNIEAEQLMILSKLKIDNN